MGQVHLSSHFGTDSHPLAFLYPTTIQNFMLHSTYPNIQSLGSLPIVEPWRRILGIWRSLHMVFPIGRSVKIYCIWSIFGIWRSIACHQSLALKIFAIWSIFGIEDLCIWSIFGIWRSIAYDQSLALKIFAYDLSLAFEDLLHMINLWHWRSIAYE